MAISLYSTRIGNEEIYASTLTEAGNFDPSWQITIPRQMITVDQELDTAVDNSIQLIKRSGKKVYVESGIDTLQVEFDKENPQGNPGAAIWIFLDKSKSWLN